MHFLTVQSQGIINPIPKRSTLDPRDPIIYWGITLASAVYKLYIRYRVLNYRLNVLSEVNGKLNYEQNGLRQGRSCGDHLTMMDNINN